MKKINIDLSVSGRDELMRIREKSTDYRSERALAVLHCADGKRPCQIALILKRSSLTICSWLHAYKKCGISGLARKYSPGRPSLRKSILMPKIDEYLKKPPRSYGWGEDIWTVKVIMAQFKKDTNQIISRYTIVRALRDLGYSAKRSKKTMPQVAPTREYRLNKIRKIAQDIAKLKITDNVEVMFLDESHFTTDPYVVRGWSKRGEPFFSITKKARKLHHIWGIRTGERCFLLEER